MDVWTAMYNICKVVVDVYKRVAFKPHTYCLGSSTRLDKNISNPCMHKVLVVVTAVHLFISHQPGVNISTRVHCIERHIRMTAIEHQGGELLTVYVDDGFIELEFEFTDDGIKFYRGEYELSIDTMTMKQKYTKLTYDNSILRLEGSDGFIEVNVDRVEWENAYKLVEDDYACVCP